MTTYTTPLFRDTHSCDSISIYNNPTELVITLYLWFIDTNEKVSEGDEGRKQQTLDMGFIYLDKCFYNKPFWIHLIRKVGKQIVISPKWWLKNSLFDLFLNRISVSQKAKHVFV